LSCINGSDLYNLKYGENYEYEPKTNRGVCNIWDCNCDHCYGEKRFCTHLHPRF
jgi:hypothetical protein